MCQVLRTSLTGDIESVFLRLGDDVNALGDSNVGDVKRTAHTLGEIDSSLHYIKKAYISSKSVNELGWRKDILQHLVKIYFIIIMGIFCVFIPLSLITLAPRYIAAHEVELFFVLETALGPFWVWLVIHEQPSIKTIIGGVCIVLLIFTHTFLEFKEKKSL